MKKNLEEMQVKVANKRAILESHDGEEFSLITVAKNVLCEDGTTMQDYFDSHSEPNISTKIVNSNSMSKVGQGDNVDFSDNVMNGAYEDVVLKGKSLVNVIQEPSSQDVVLPYSFEEGERATINDTHSNGRVEIEVKGRTLVNLAKVRSVDAYNKCLDRNIPIKPNTKYIGIFKATYYQETGGNYACFMTSTVSVGDDPSYNGDRIYSISCPDGLGTEHKLNKGDQQFTFTSKSNEQYLHIRTGGGKGFTYEDMIVLEYQEGMENWDIPYFEGMASVRMPTLHTNGKNLLPYNEMFVSPFTSATPYITKNVATFPFTLGVNGRGVGIKFKVEPNTTYTLSSNVVVPNTVVGVAFYKNESDTTNHNNKLGIAFSTNIEESTKTFTTPNECNWIVCGVYILYTYEQSGGTVVISEMPKLQLEKNTQATTYEPHKSSILSLPEEVVLRSLPNGVCDTFNIRTGVYIQYIVERVLDGSENWGLSGTLPDNTTFTRFDLNISGLLTTAKHPLNCDKLPYIFIHSLPGGSKTIVQECITNHSENETLSIVIKKDKLTEVNATGFKQWLSQNPIIVQYELKTPVTTKINLPSTLKSWNTTTHIYSEIPENTLYPTLSHSNPTYPVIIKPSTKYSIVANSYSNNHTNSAINFNLGGATASTTVGSRVTTITTPSTLSNELLTMSGRGNKLNNVMVIEGDVVGDEPYFEGICDCKTPILLNVGKNLFDVDYFVEKVNNPNVCYKNEEGSLVIKGGYHSVKINIPYSTTMTYLQTSTNTANNGASIFEAQHPDGTCTHIGVGVNTTLERKTWSIKKPIIAIGFNNWAGGENILKDIMLVKTEDSTAYEPYKSNILSCETYFDETTQSDKTIVLRSLPNGVCDTLDVKTGEYVQIIGEITLDGTKRDDLVYHTVLKDNDGDFIRMIINGCSFYDNNKYGNCDKLPFYHEEKTKDSVEAVFPFAGEKHFYIKIKTSRINGAETMENNSSQLRDAFLNWLAQNPITVQYELATPIVKQVNVEGYPYAYENGHILLESGSQEQSLTPTIEYSIVANRGGQIRSNQRMVERHQKKLDSLYAMTLVNMIDSQYKQVLMKLKSELGSEVTSWDI